MHDLLTITDPKLLKSEIAALLPAAHKERILGALSVAEQAHSGQLRKDGTPYILHPLRITLSLIRDGHTHPDLLATALLHDVIEDTPTSYEDVSSVAGETVAHAVAALSKKQNNGISLPEFDYLQQLAGASEIVKTVKTYDRLDNLATVKHFKNPAKIASYIAEAEEYYLPLVIFHTNLYEKLAAGITTAKQEHNLS